MQGRAAFSVVVLGLLLISLLLWAAMAFGTLAHVRSLAGGLAPFDLRPFGYWPEEVNAVLSALGAEGRRYYAEVQLPLDAIYPAVYAVSRVLLLWWLTMPGRIGGGNAPLLVRVGLLVLPVAAGAIDYVENAKIAVILAEGTSVDRVTIASASIATETKSLATSLTEFVSLGLGIAAVWTWWSRRAGATAAPPVA